MNQFFSLHHCYVLLVALRCISRLSLSLSLLHAQHAKRLHPTKIKTKTVVEWGYQVDEIWTTVDPKQVTIPDGGGFDKTIGFQGLPDPATGFYCVSARTS